jgi:hypothetical protein
MPSAVTHFYSGQPMHFCSGVDRVPMRDIFQKIASKIEEKDRKSERARQASH